MSDYSTTKLCACGKLHTKTVDDFITAKGAVNKLPEYIKSYNAKKAFTEKQNKKIQDYIDGKLDIDAESAPVMQEFIDMFAKDEKTRVAASEKLANFLNELNNLENTDQVTPDVTENQEKIYRFFNNFNSCINFC